MRQSTRKVEFEIRRIPAKYFLVVWCSFTACQWYCRDLQLAYMSMPSTHMSVISTFFDEMSSKLETVGEDKRGDTQCRGQYPIPVHRIR